jgi:hypothetical protein
MFLVGIKPYMGERRSLPKFDALVEKSARLMQDTSYVLVHIEDFFTEVSRSSENYTRFDDSYFANKLSGMSNIVPLIIDDHASISHKLGGDWIEPKQKIITSSENIKQAYINAIDIYRALGAKLSQWNASRYDSISRFYNLSSNGLIILLFAL